MSLTTSTITGRIPLPNNAASGSTEIIFTLNATDTEGVNVIPAESAVRYRMTPTGEFPAGAVLWRNTEGLRGTSYRVEVQWIELEAGRPITKDVLLGYIQVGDEPSYSIGDLLASPSSSELGWYVNVPQSQWVDFNERLDYMYSIAESSLPATVERAVEAELAAAQSALEAEQSAQAAAGSAVAAVEDVEAARDAALTDVGTARSGALTDISNAQDTSVEAVETARDEALGQINPKVQQAETAAQTATTKAGEANTSAGAAATSAGNAATSETNAGISAGAAATSASNAYGSEVLAAASASSAAGALANVEAASTAAAVSEANALASEVAARSSETAAAGSAGAAAASAGAASSSAGAALNSASAAALSAGSANDARIATQELMDQFANFRFLGKVEWWQGDPAMIPSGFLPPSGQLLNRADYPDLWEDVNNGVFISTTDALWLNSSVVGDERRNRAMFSTGNGTTTFRMPDLNSLHSSSTDMGGLYLRGGRTHEGRTSGQLLGDAIRNLYGTAYGFFGQGDAAANGVFTTPKSSDNLFNATGAAGHAVKNITFNASNTVPTAAENRPITAVGLWIMLVNGAPARQFNPETSAGLGSNTFGGLQRFNAGFEWVGVVPQLIQTDVDQGLTVAQKLMAATNTGAVSYASAQALTAAERLRALQNIGGVPYSDDFSATITAAQKAIARANVGLGTPAEFAFISQAITLSSATTGQHTRYYMDFRLSNSSGGEIWRLVQGSFVKAASSSDSIGITYGFTFLNGGSYIMLNNGDGQVDGSIILSPFNVTLSGFGCAARLNSNSYLGVYRGNYSVLGRIS